jgi:hypothetical protein
VIHAMKRIAPWDIFTNNLFLGSTYSICILLRCYFLFPLIWHLKWDFLFFMPILIVILYLYTIIYFSFFKVKSYMQISIYISIIFIIISLSGYNLIWRIHSTLSCITWYSISQCVYIILGYISLLSVILLLISLFLILLSSNYSISSAFLQILSALA